MLQIQHHLSSFDDNGAGNGFVTDIDPGSVPAGLIDPIAQYDHDEGISITGGFVYGGAQIDRLAGVYIFGDWSRSFGLPLGRLFYLDANNGIREFRRPGNQPLGLFLDGFGRAPSVIYLPGMANGQ